MAPRPGPLMPYPVELFSAEPRVSGTPLKHLRPNKRPHSPGRGCLDSPAKRRLRAEEGSVGSRHPRSPLSATSNSARFAPDHFQALLEGPDSPAKRLQFGSLKPAGSPSAASESTAYDTSRSGSRTPKCSPKRTSTTRVRRSPRLSARASSVVSELAVEEQLVTRLEVASSSVRASIPEPVLVPRVVSPPDVQSIHYPGFDIFQDPHLVLPSTSSLSRTPAPEESPSDKEHEKENFAPPKKTAKKALNPSTPSGSSLSKAALFSPSTRGASPSVGRVKPVPASPHPKHVCDYLSAAHITPKERIVRNTPSPASTLVGATPGRTPLGKEARRQMRRALEDEVDDFDGDDDL